MPTAAFLSENLILSGTLIVCEILRVAFFPEKIGAGRYPQRIEWLKFSLEADVNREWYVTLLRELPAEVTVAQLVKYTPHLGLDEVCFLVGQEGEKSAYIPLPGIKVKGTYLVATYRDHLLEVTQACREKCVDVNLPFWRWR